MQPPPRPSGLFGPSPTILIGALARAYCWISDQVYLRFAWGFDLLTGVLTLGRFARWRRSARAYLPDDQVLDLGCGTGRFLREWPVAARRLVGIDRSAGMATAFRQQARRHPHPAQMVRADATRLPFRDGSFKAALSTFPTRFLLEPAVLREAARVVRCEDERSGRLVVVGLYLTTRAPWLQRIFDALYGAPTTVRQAQVVERAAIAGLSVSNGVPTEGLIRPTLHLAQRSQEAEHGVG